MNYSVHPLSPKKSFELGDPTFLRSNRLDLAQFEQAAMKQKRKEDYEV